MYSLPKHKTIKLQISIKIVIYKNRRNSNKRFLEKINTKIYNIHPLNSSAL